MEVRIRKGWIDEGKRGVVLAGPLKEGLNQSWYVVLWSGEDEPDLHKAGGLDIAEIIWKKAESL